MSSKVRKANRATSDQLAESLSESISSGETSHRLQICTASELTDAERKEVWCLFEKNMYHLYNGSSMGWNPEEKSKELFDTDSRFVLLRGDIGGTQGSPEIAAYTMFRFDVENRMRVLYCYELQIHETHRRRGLGKGLMEQLCTLAAKWAMQKVMLTVFRANETAIAFYKSIGFSLDETSPGYDEGEEEWVDEEEDYYILSRSVS